MAGLFTYVMDISSLGLGPEKYEPLNPKWGQPMKDDAKPADARPPTRGPAVRAASFVKP
jgi:hypothetical protein